MNNEQLRAEARALLTGKWGNLALIWLILYAIGGIIGALPGLGGLAQFFIGGQFALGITLIFFKILRNEEYKIEEMFEGFKQYTRALVAYLLIMLYTFLWMLLLIVPGIIASISYSMTFFIMAEDSKIEPQEAMKLSQQIMYGHKTEYFMLMLSFIGWFIVCLFTLGIGFLFLTSYIYTVQILFYQRIKPQIAQQPAQEQVIFSEQP